MGFVTGRVVYVATCTSVLKWIRFNLEYDWKIEMGVTVNFN